MASIAKRGDTWQARVSLGGNRYRSKAFPTKGMAAEWARTQEAEIADGVAATPGADAVTVGQLWPRLLATRVGRMAPATVAHNRAMWAKHVEPRWGTERASRVRTSDVEAWSAGMLTAGVGLPTVRQSVILLSLLMRMAVRDKTIRANPVSGVELPDHVPARKQFITKAELAAILAAIPDANDRLLVEVLAYCGLRVSEALGLTAGNVDRDHDVLHIREVVVDGHRKVPKNRSSVRVVPVPPETMARIRSAVRASTPKAPVFRATDHRNFSKRVLRPACVKAEGPVISLHELRHYAASTWVAAGVPLPTVAAILGHSTVTELQRTYVHVQHDAHAVIRAAMLGAVVTA